MRPRRHLAVSRTLVLSVVLSWSLLASSASANTVTESDSGSEECDINERATGAVAVAESTIACATSFDLLESGIHQAAAYLHAQIRSDGQWVYRRDASSGQTIPGRYNLLRHAGTLLALAEYHAEFPPDARQEQAMQSSLDFLRSCCLAPSQPGADDLAVWSDPILVGGARRYALAKLGGAGLTLAAMAQWRRIQPGRVSIADMQALGRFILSLQQSNGRFQSLHALQAGNHDPDWVSLYYPGEAALALVLLFEHDRDDRWLEAAIDALQALARDRETLISPPPDHWALLATARLWQQDHRALEEAMPSGFSWLPAQGRTALAPLLLDHAQAIAQGMIDEQVASQTRPCSRGSFTKDARSTPTAIRLEGLLALLTILPAGTDRARLEASVAAGVGFLQAAQWTTGPASGAFSRVSIACPTTDPRAHEVRIDYVQHALAALRGYRTLVRKP